MKCFFCAIQNDSNDKQVIIDGKNFFTRLDDFPVSKGHVEVVPKIHIASLFELSEDMAQDLFLMISQAKEKIDDQFHPDGYTIGVNEGEAAGRSIPHLHIHLIPRYRGDVENPRGGIRNIISGKGDYRKLAEAANRSEYLK